MQVEQDALWTMMGKDEPQVLQAVGSNPLTHSHPRFVNGSEGEPEGEGEGEGEGGLEVKAKEPEGPGEGEAGQRQGARGSGAGSGVWQGAEAAAVTAGELREQLAAVQRQLEEQGQLLRAVAARLGTPAEPAGTAASSPTRSPSVGGSSCAGDAPPAFCST